MKTKRVAPGYYEVETPGGTYRVERITKDDGNTGRPLWLITWPDEDSADECTDTLREAKTLIAADQVA